MKSRILGLFLVFVIISMAFNPYVSKSTTGQVAHAILLPVKVSHDSSGEIWRLPNGEFVFKTGGEAPLRDNINGISLDGTIIKSTSVNVDIESVVDSEIIYKDKNNLKIAKENWFIYESKNKITWDSVNEKNLLIKTIPISETVGSYTVTDYEKQAVKEKTMNNIFGSLWIEYMINEGKPLKHTLNFTATQGGTFQLCQEFSEFDFDIIKKYDDDTKSSDTIDVKNVESGKLDAVSLDIISKDSLDSKIKSDPLLLLPEKVEFEKNGKFILGEITSGAKQDFQSFSYNDITNTAVFCYGDFSLKQGESFLVDPDTYSSSSPSYRTYVYDNGGSGTVCDTTSLVNNAGGDITSGMEKDVNTQECYHGLIQWDISSIPTGADVTNTVFKYETNGATSTRDTLVKSIQFQPSTASTLTKYLDAGNGTTYVTIPAPSLGTNQNTDLGTSADSDVESQLSVDWFAIGLRASDETIDTTNHLWTIAGSAGTPNPTLEITYSTEVDTLVTVNHYRGNTTALTTCNLIQSNSSTSRTIACNSSGQATFTGLSGNQNMTLLETNTSFVLNKTRNFTPSTNLIINATVVEVNCSQTGSATDIRLWYNQSNVHTMTNMTRPTCNSANVISWNGTFSPDGKNSMTGVTDVRIEIRNATAFGKNSIVEYVNGTDQTATFSSGVITISDITVGSGTGTSKLLKQYVLLDGRPDIPTGLSATTSSSTQIDLSWTAGNSGVTSISGYKIYRSTDGSTWSVLSANTNSTSTSYSDTGLTAGVTYYYKLGGINTFGAGVNSTSANATPTAGGGSSGGGSSGGGSITPSVSDTLNKITEFSLVSKTLSLRAGEASQGIINVSWDSGQNLIIKSITFGSTPLKIAFSQPPFSLYGSGEIKSTGQLLFNVIVPEDTPETRYTIPVTVVATHGSDEITQVINLVVDLGANTEPSLVIVSLMAVLVISMMIYRSYVSKHKVHHKNGTLLKKIENMEGSQTKKRKNGSLLKDLRRLEP